MKSHEVASAMRSAGLDVVAECAFSVMARGDRAVVHALEYPRGWRLQNARESRAATKAAIVKRPADVERFCSSL